MNKNECIDLINYTITTLMAEHIIDYETLEQIIPLKSCASNATRAAMLSTELYNHLIWIENNNYNGTSIFEKYMNKNTNKVNG